ncbi:anthrone oxygenase family protein [Herbidospora sp. NBRC 101105]|uniref:anthrone oxygenase family protein n=1 Tax=Herbidospora sp. NBRC 101105 TaxID=3032195 RepID=UPI0024A01161|nr:anthrone oxygenase family protein [Herbidospora sp. NBRC 101105]GLX94958.1 membrane protein [Herbidospora sp. NBRC 101105]
MFVLTVIVAGLALLLMGNIAGLFYAYSVSVIPGLNASRADHAVAAMQQINVKILNPLFFASFIGAPLVAALAGVLLLGSGHRGAALLFFAATAVYVLGSFVPTAIVNVPLNNALLAAGEITDPARAARVWAEFAPKWAPWNHLRTVACCVSLLLSGAALFVWAGDR